MLWEVEITPRAGEIDRAGLSVLAEAEALGAVSVRTVSSARSYLIEGDVDEEAVVMQVARFLTDPIVETSCARPLPDRTNPGSGIILLNVLFHPGVTDNVGQTARDALRERGLDVERVATCRKYRVNGDASEADVARLCAKALANDAIEHVVRGPLLLKGLGLGSNYRFELLHVPLRAMDAAALERQSREGQLYLSLVEMQTIQRYFRDLGRDPTDVELETIAQTWSEHCSHKTLAGRIRYRDERGERQFENMLKETIFEATRKIREKLGKDDWCVSVFKDNAGVVRFNETYDVCFKVETHNHPSALEPYGGANTGIGGVIRDPLGTGLGARPFCNTDVFCFAPPDTAHDSLPPGVLHPKSVMRGVVAGVRDYGNRMGIPTVNGAVYFDERYLGNPLVYCGNAALLPIGKSQKRAVPGDHIVAVGGRTGRDGIHGATFSSAELTHESESLSGGAVQIGNAVTEKMVMDVVLAARDRELFHAITDCGAGGFSSAVGEMGEETGAEVWLEQAPLKYAGLSYTEIWISEAQERMVLAVPPEHWREFHELCASEGVEATVIGRFTDTRRLVLMFDGTEVGHLDMAFLHDGRPPVVREAVWRGQPRGAGLRRDVEKGGGGDQEQGISSSDAAGVSANNATLRAILSSLNVCSREWIIRQYDHEVQAGSVVKPLVGVAHDGPSDAAVLRPDLASERGVVIACGMNPHVGESVPDSRPSGDRPAYVEGFDPYWMAAGAIDEAVRNCVAVGADPARIAILDNFCWGNTERPETLGSLVRAALGCHDTAVAFGTPFISGKDSLNNEFTYVDAAGGKRTIEIPPSLLISAIGQIEDVAQAVTMDLKEPGNLLFLVGRSAGVDLGGSHFNLVRGVAGGFIPGVDLQHAPLVFASVHRAIRGGLVRSCHDLSEGGLAVALAEMAFAGGLGAEASLAAFQNIDGIVLFNEANTRFLMEVAPDSEREFLEAIPFATRIGQVTAGDRLIVRGEKERLLIDESIHELKECWQRPLAWE